MSEVYHLVVEHGSEKGRKIFVPPEGARLGRSSKNDIVIVDPLLSRHHCRLFFKPGEGLWIADLGSANQCLINEKPVQEAQLHIGDMITAGSTTFKVVDSGLGPEHRDDVKRMTIAATQQSPSPVSPSIQQQSASIDLGLGPAEKPTSRRDRMLPLIILGIAAIVFALAVWIPKFFRKEALPRQQGADSAPTLEISYEKITASPDNIFRYCMKLSKACVLSIKIDDIENNRHVQKEKNVDPACIEDLVSDVREAAFFDLSDEYKGTNPNVFEQWTLSVTIGRKTHQTRITNRVPPENLESLIKAFEEFGRNELGLWAIQYPSEKLLSMAQDAFLNAKKLHDEREIKYENLANALRNLQEAEACLDTVDPKPDYYAELLTLKKDYKQELQEKYEDQNFKAERATNLKQWEEAATELRILLEMIPDRADPRHQGGRKKLLDVERRLDRKK